MDAQTSSLLTPIQDPKHKLRDLGVRYAEASNALRFGRWPILDTGHSIAAVMGSLLGLIGTGIVLTDASMLTVFAGTPHPGVVLVALGAGVLVIARRYARARAYRVTADPDQQFEFALSRAIIEYNHKCEELRMRIEADEAKFRPFPEREQELRLLRVRKARILRGFTQVKFLRGHRHTALAHGFEESMAELVEAERRVQGRVNLELARPEELDALLEKE